MQNWKGLAGVAIFILIVAIVATMISPTLGAVMGPILLGVAAIIAAIKGKGPDEQDVDDTVEKDFETE